MSCASAAHYPSHTVSDRLFFGRSMPGGGAVTDADWETFVREVISPRFPHGLTIWRAEGQWLGDDGKPASEQTMVLELIHEGGASNEKAVNEIADEYKRRFKQDAVMRVTTPGYMQLLR
ncbi:MAG TPA: DUF3574 domain-containing protein [Thermoanaerobaculia bacterium]|nr:DUF3574 domain-containing protein [Thermoanaerobaculia bacterium]